MNNLYEILEMHHIHPLSYLKKKNVYIVHTKDKSYVIKLNTSNYDIYKYLISHGFNFFPQNYNYKSDTYDLSLYIENDEEKEEQKITDLMEIIAILHKKTTYKRCLDLDEIKEIYENLKTKIQNSRNYYVKLNNEIDKEIFFSPSMYLLVRNISLIYYMLNYSEHEIDEWYQRVAKEKSIRVSLLHNNIDLEHLIVQENRYLISWDKASFDFPINDIQMFFNKYYKLINLSDMLNLYCRINPLSELEKKLLLVKLSIPSIIELSLNTYDDTIKINNMIYFLNKVYELIKKKDNK